MLKVSELTGEQLDYWVALAEGVKADRLWFTRLSKAGAAVCTMAVRHDDGADTARSYRPSTDWAQGGPLIQKYYAYLEYGDRGDYWECFVGKPGGGEGDTPLQAVCRAVVRAAFGDEVEEVRVAP